MKKEMMKRLKGLMALVLCFSMMFGSSLTVFAKVTGSVKLRGVLYPAGGGVTTETGSGSVSIVGSSSKPKSNGATGHKHSFEWDMTKLPTQNEDGEASYICKICSHVAAKQPVTRWQWFVKQYRELIKDAEQNATITFEADDMPCISDYMLSFNAARPDVTVIVHFTYEGVKYELTIPAGTDFSVIQNDTDGFYGYLGLAAKIGLTAKVLS